MLLFHLPSLGKPQALISEDDLKQKQVAQTSVVQRNNINEMHTMSGESHEEIQAYGMNDLWTIFAEEDELSISYVEKLSHTLNVRYHVSPHWWQNCKSP